MTSIGLELFDLSVFNCAYNNVSLSRFRCLLQAVVPASLKRFHLVLNRSMSMLHLRFEFYTVLALVTLHEIFNEPETALDSVHKVSQLLRTLLGSKGRVVVLTASQRPVSTAFVG